MARSKEKKKPLVKGNVGSLIVAAAFAVVVVAALVIATVFIPRVTDFSTTPQITKQPLFSAGLTSAYPKWIVNYTGVSGKEVSTGKISQTTTYFQVLSSESGNTCAFNMQANYLQSNLQGSGDEFLSKYYLYQLSKLGGGSSPSNEHYEQIKVKGANNLLMRAISYKLQSSVPTKTTKSKPATVNLITAARAFDKEIVNPNNPKQKVLPVLAVTYQCSGKSLDMKTYQAIMSRLQVVLN